MDDEEFNSSDMEFSPVQKKFATAGMKSIASMRKSIVEDCISSEKTLKTLTDSRGTPSSQYRRAHWLNRLITYAATNKIIIDKQTGPDHSVLLRFIDTIVKHIGGRARDAPVPLRTTLKGGFLALQSALTFEYPKFNLTKHECARIDALIDELADEGALLRGRKRDKLQWIGIFLVEKMSTCWLRAALNDGCLSWDIVIHKALTLVLQSALICRSGEIALSKHYSAEHMRWSHLEMKVLAGGQDTIDDIQLTCTLEFEKGAKREKNENRDVPLRTLRDPSLNVVCPIKLLLVQALRSGNVSTVDSALTQATRREDRTIQWLFPERPVIPQLNKCSAFISWELPGGTQQINRTVQELGLVAGIQDVRRGGARDLANLRPSSNIPVGIATNEVSRSMVQSSGSYNNGAMDKYVGDIEQDLFTSKAEQMIVSRKAPALGEQYRKRRLENNEITAYCKANDLDATSQVARQKAGKLIHSKRKVDWIESQKSLQAVTGTTSKANLSSSSTSSAPSRGATPTTLATSRNATLTSLLGDSIQNSLIDPRLPLLDNDEVDINNEEAEKLSSIMLTKVANISPDEQEVCLGLFVDNACQGDKISLLTLPGREFIELFSQINIVRNRGLQGYMQTLDKHFPLYCPMGESRDYPTLFEYTCDVCGEYKSFSRQNIDIHKVTCTGKKV